MVAVFQLETMVLEADQGDANDSGKSGRQVK